MSKNPLTLSQKLREMLFKKNMKPIDLARDLNMQAPTIHRIVTGKTLTPTKSSLEAIATYFNVSVDQLTSEDTILPNNIDEIKSDALRQNAKAVPLTKWEDIGFMENIVTNEAKLVVLDVSDKAFATIMPDYSMEPVLREGSILIFDPEKPCTDRSYILVKLYAANSYVVRQLLVDVDKKFIKSLTSDIGANSLRLLTPDDEIIARIVEVRNKL